MRRHLRFEQMVIGDSEVGSRVVLVEPSVIIPVQPSDVNLVRPYRDGGEGVQFRPSVRPVLVGVGDKANRRLHFEQRLVFQARVIGRVGPCVHSSNVDRVFIVRMPDVQHDAGPHLRFERIDVLVHRVDPLHPVRSVVGELLLGHAGHTGVVFVN